MKPTEPPIAGQVGIRLSTLMLLVAATGIGIVATRQCHSQMRALHMDDGLSNLHSWLILASPMIMSWSMALMAGRLLPPRPRRVEIFRQPGFVANWVMFLVISLNALKTVALNKDRLLNGDTLLAMFDYMYFWPTGSQCGAGIMVAWSTLALAGCWQAEPSWIDRLGRGLGTISIASFLAGNVAWLLWVY